MNALKYLFPASVICVQLTIQPAHADITVSAFSPSDVYSSDTMTLDMNVGIVGFTIENFEDAVLESEITISAEGASASSTVPIGDIRSEFPDALWDGSSAYLPTVRDSGNVLQPCKITFPTGTTSVGIGLGDIETDVQLLVNGISYGVINLMAEYESAPKNARGIYFRVDANLGDVITMITLNPIGTGTGDGVFIDHLAWDNDKSITVTVPDASTVYVHNQGVSANWSGAPGGGMVRAELYRGNIFIDLYHNETSNDGNLNRSACPEFWGVGDDFRVKITHVPSGQFGWSAPFTIECDPLSSCLDEDTLICNPLTGNSYFLSGSALSAGAAEAWARDHVGHLVTINDIGENQWLVDNFGDLEPFWIGLFQPSESPEPDAAWDWLNTEVNLYRNWAAGVPDDGGGVFSEDSVVMNDGGSGLWNDVEGISTDALFTLAFRAIAEVPGNPCPSDLNCDGVVDTADLGILLGEFGACFWAN